MNSVTKTCRLCGESQPLDGFYARKSSADGRRSECKSCVKNRAKANWQANREERLVARRAWYEANADSWNEQRRNARSQMTAEQRQAELDRNRAWVARNRSRVDAYRKDYYWRNRETRLAGSRVYHLQNRDSVLAVRRERWSTDPARRARNAAWRSEHRPQLAEASRRYYRDNRDKVHAYQAAYRVANRDVTRRLSRLRYLRQSTAAFKAPRPDLRAAKWDYWGNSCWMCGGPATTIDHVKPLSKGGSHLLANLRPACKPCNSSKHARWFGVSKLSLFVRA